MTELVSSLKSNILRSTSAIISCRYIEGISYHKLAQHDSKNNWDVVLYSNIYIYCIWRSTICLQLSCFTSSGRERRTRISGAKEGCWPKWSARAISSIYLFGNDKTSCGQWLRYMRWSMLSGFKVRLTHTPNLSYAFFARKVSHQRATENPLESIGKVLYIYCVKIYSVQ